MFYISHSPNAEQSLQYAQELEHIHNELNYLNIRSMARRLAVITALFYGWYAFYEFGNSNWEDYYEPKHEINLYNELDEGGDEGDDD